MFRWVRSQWSHRYSQLILNQVGYPFQLGSWSEGWLKLKSFLEKPSDKCQKTHIIRIRFMAHRSFFFLVRRIVENSTFFLLFPKGRVKKNSWIFPEGGGVSDGRFSPKKKKQAGAELSQAQVKDEVIVEVRSWCCRSSWSSTTSPGGWSDKTKVILNSTQFKFKLKLKFELSLAIIK